LRDSMNKANEAANIIETYFGIREAKATTPEPSFALKQETVATKAKAPVGEQGKLITEPIARAETPKFEVPKPSEIEGRTSTGAVSQEFLQKQPVQKEFVAPLEGQAELPKVEAVALTKPPVAKGGRNQEGHWPVSS